MDTLWQSICDHQEAIEKEINHTDEDRRPIRLRPFQENLDPNKCSPGNFSEILDLSWYTKWYYVK